MRVASALAIVALLGAGARASTRSDEAADRANALFAAGDYGGALAACDAISDPVLRAEWRFHVLYAGGDLEGALAAALAGLDQAPAHAALSQNALVAGLKLRRASTVERIRDELRASSSALPEQLAGDVERVIELDARAERLTARARTFVFSSVAIALLALVGCTLKIRR